MIFLTVGSELPFDRLVKTVDLWAKENVRYDVVGQIADPGPSGYYPEWIQWYEYISNEKYTYLIEKSDLVIAHAGMGAILSSLSKRKPILVLPRKAKLMETRNDHQIATAHRFQGHDGVFVAQDETFVDSLLDDLLRKGDLKYNSGLSEFGSETLIQEIRAFILKTIEP